MDDGGGEVTGKNQKNKRWQLGGRRGDEAALSLARTLRQTRPCPPFSTLSYTTSELASLQRIFELSTERRLSVQRSPFFSFWRPPS